MIKGKLINNYSEEYKQKYQTNMCDIDPITFYTESAFKLEYDSVFLADDGTFIFKYKYYNKKNKYNKRIKNRERLYLKRKALGRKL